MAATKGNKRTSTAKKAATKKKTASRRTPKKKAAPKKKVAASKKRPAPKKKAARKKKPAPTAQKGRAYADSQQKLAEFLNCSRSTINRLLRKDGAPAKTADGKYPLVEWQEFYAKNNKDATVDDAELLLERKAKRRRAEVALEKEELELAIAKGELISTEEACRIVSQAFAGTVQGMKDMEHTLAPLCSGLDVPAARAEIRKGSIKALEKFSLGDWAKKKAFWRTVYVLLRDLQATSSLGNGQSAT